MAEQLVIPQTIQLTEVEKLATCNKCGVTDSAWQQGHKSKKWYLAKAVPSTDGKLYVDRHAFHKCEYHNVLAHQAKPAPQPKQVKPKANPFLAIPKGRYALLNDNGVIDFFQVDQPEQGNRWYGWTFVKKLIGSPGDYRKVPIRGEAATAILKRLVSDPMTAMVLYGTESGVCGNCASPLSDPDSLVRGLGPICAANLGYKKVMA